MIVTGKVLSVREGSFADKTKAGEMVPMLYVDLYDETLHDTLQLSAKLGAGVVIPKEDEKISADVTRIAPSKFRNGSGFNLTVRNIRLVNGTSAGAGSPPPPAAKK